MDVLSAQNGFLARCEMHMEVEPAILPIFHGEVRFDAHDVAGHVLKAFALANGPFVF